MVTRKGMTLIERSMNKPLIIITGASSGIGAAMAQAFAAKGYPLGLLARNLAAMEALQLPNALCIATDVTDINAIQRAVQDAESKFGPTDCLINNAGYGISGEFTAIAHEQHAHMVSLNLQGLINGIEVVLPRMQERKKGTIINISSLADRYPRPAIATYAATKAAVRSLSDSLRIANASHNIRVCNLAPAKTITPLLKKAGLTEDQAIPVANLAATAVWMYEQPQSICIRDLVIAHTEYAV